MSGYAIPTCGDVIVKVNGSKLALVRGYNVKSYRYEGSNNILIEIDRLLTPVGLTDGVDFFNLANFTVAITYPGFEVAYRGCEWVEIYEYCGEDGEIHEKAVIKAIERTKA
ncbi:MAG TPA: hypothetical protein GXX17_01320 [Clostridiales bacterium]|nr:hypothetical protein [Clostridiales bacterium]